MKRERLSGPENRVFTLVQGKKLDFFGKVNIKTREAGKQSQKHV